MIKNRSTSPAGGNAERGTVLFVAGVVVGLMGTVLAVRWSRDSGMELVQNVRDLAEESFVREVDREELVDDAVRGMLDGLDRYSRFYGPEEIARLDRETSGEFRGIGVVFRRPVTDGQILFPFPDSPADRAGLQVGDTLLEIDGIAVAEMEPGGLQSHIQRRGVDSVRLRVQSRAGEERVVDVTPERVVDPTVRHAHLVDRTRAIGYVAIRSFSHRTPGELDRAILFLRDEGLEALIIDLRGNPGGILDAAALVANRFVKEGRIVATRTRRITQVTYARPEEATYAGMPLVLLIDEGSASASEVLAGALQDHGAAILVGVPTYGKGTVQTITPLEKFQARVKITTATYYTPAWRRIERNGQGGGNAGIAPDLRVSLDEGGRNALYAHLSTYSPPPSSMAAIRTWEQEEDLDLLSSPPVDSQLKAAIDLLREALDTSEANEEE